MKQTFDNLVDSILTEVFGGNPYKPEDKIECPFRLQDSLAAKGINVSEDEASEMYNEYKNKSFGEAEKAINAKRSTTASQQTSKPSTSNQQANPYEKMDKQDSLYSQIKVDPREQNETQY